MGNNKQNKKQDNRDSDNSESATAATCSDLVIVYDEDMVNLTNYETS